MLAQVRERPQPEWQQAYAFRGKGTTLDRKMRIETLYERWVPIPASEADDMLHVQEFIDTVKELLHRTIEGTRDALVKEADPSGPTSRQQAHTTNTVGSTRA